MPKTQSRILPAWKNMKKDVEQKVPMSLIEMINNADALQDRQLMQQEYETLKELFSKSDFYEIYDTVRWHWNSYQFEDSETYADKEIKRIITKLKNAGGFENNAASNNAKDQNSSDNKMLDAVIAGVQENVFSRDTGLFNEELAKDYLNHPAKCVEIIPIKYWKQWFEPGLCEDMMKDILKGLMIDYGRKGVVDFDNLGDYVSRERINKSLDIQRVNSSQPTV